MMNRMSENKGKFKVYELTNMDINGIITPNGSESAPIILVISASSLVRSTVKAYLLDLGYRIAGPYEAFEEGRTFIRRSTPDLIIFDVLNNFKETSFIEETMKNEIPNTPLILLGNKNPDNISKSVSFLSLPLDHQRLGNELQELIPFIKISPIEDLINFVNRFFLKLIQLSPENYRKAIEEKINSTIFEFCSRNSDFTKKSDESTSIIVTTNNKIILSDVVAHLEYHLKQMIIVIDDYCQSNWTKALIKDAIEALLIQSKTIPDGVKAFAGQMGVNIKEFQSFMSRMVPKLKDSEKATFVAFLSLDDNGPSLVSYVTNDKKISKDLNDDLAARILTLVGQGSSYHEGVFGPIPVPSSNNICAVIWSKILLSEIQDNRMKGKSLSVVIIGFQANLLTHLPQADQLREIFKPLTEIEHINEITQIQLNHLQKIFLESLI